MFFEQHMRSSLGIFPEPLMTHLMPQAMDSILMEKARQQLQVWGRSPYSELLVQQMYQRSNLNNQMNLGLWQGQWSQQLSIGFLNNHPLIQNCLAGQDPQSQQQQQQQQKLQNSPTSQLVQNTKLISPTEQLHSELQQRNRAMSASARYSPYPTDKAQIKTSQVVDCKSSSENSLEALQNVT